MIETLDISLHSPNPEDHGEIARIVRDYRAYLKSVVRAKMTREMRLREDSSDVVQESTVQAVKYLQSGRGPNLNEAPQSVRAWLREVAIATLCRIRRHGGGKSVSAFDINQTSETTGKSFIDRTESPIRMLLKSEERGFVQKALAQLTEADRSIITMRNVDGLAFERIAKIWDLSPFAVYRAHDQAMERFRNAFFQMVLHPTNLADKEPAGK